MNTITETQSTVSHAIQIIGNTFAYLFWVSVIFVVIGALLVFVNYGTLQSVAIGQVFAISVAVMFSSVFGMVACTKALKLRGE